MAHRIHSYYTISANPIYMDPDYNSPLSYCWGYCNLSIMQQIKHQWCPIVSLPSSLYITLHIALQGVCCSDHHCCPQGYTCGTEVGQCIRGEHSIPLLQKLPAVQLEGGVNNVPCPGGQVACPDQTTCCQMASGQYACCPEPKVMSY